MISDLSNCSQLKWRPEVASENISSKGMTAREVKSHRHTIVVWYEEEGRGG